MKCLMLNEMKTQSLPFKPRLPMRSPSFPQPHHLLGAGKLGSEPREARRPFESFTSWKNGWWISDTNWRGIYPNKNVTNPNKTISKLTKLKKSNLIGCSTEDCHTVKCENIPTILPQGPKFDSKCLDCDDQKARKMEWATGYGLTNETQGYEPVSDHINSRRILSINMY